LKNVKFGEIQVVAQMIKADPLIVFQYDDMQQTGLIWAVKRANIDMARLLLRSFSRVNFKDLTGRSALSFAVADGNTQLVKILLCYKADPLSENNQGESILALYEKTEGKKHDIMIGQYLRLCREQLKRQALISNKWKFVKRTQNLLIVRTVSVSFFSKSHLSSLFTETDGRQKSCGPVARNPKLVDKKGNTGEAVEDVRAGRFDWDGKPSPG